MSEEPSDPVREEDKEPISDLNRFMRLLSDQDERSMILSLAAFLEEVLGRLLLACFRDCKATRDLVDGFNAPLGTLSARIEAAYSFGLATDDQYKDMEILRKVRNLFAHTWEGISLERNDVSEMVGQLSGYTFDQRPIEGGPQEKFRLTIANCCMEIGLFAERLEAGKVAAAPDVSHRVTTTPPKRGYASRSVR